MIATVSKNRFIIIENLNWKRCDKWS